MRFRPAWPGAVAGRTAGCFLKHGNGFLDYVGRPGADHRGATAPTAAGHYEGRQVSGAEGDDNDKGDAGEERQL